MEKGYPGWIARHLEPRYCACHDVSSANPKQPDYLSEKKCRDDNCPDEFEASFIDRDKDIGYQLLLWEDSTANPSTCPAYDSADPGSYDNECNQPIADRKFWQLYATGPDGKTKGDFEKFWSTGGRTTSFVWDWRRQDYPHQAGVVYNPSPKIEGARVRLLLRPVPQGSEKAQDHVTQPIDLHAAFRIDTVFAALTPWFPELWRMPEPLIPEPKPWPFPQPGPIGLRPISVPREGIEGFEWLNPPPSSATIGMMVTAYSPISGLATDPVPSRMVTGAPLDTLHFGAARVGELLYVFGGENGFSELSNGLWIGERGDDAFLWYEITTSNPTPRRDMILVGDTARNRLVMLFGKTAGGPTDEALALDLGTNRWSTLSLQITDNVPRHDAGYCSNVDHIFFYGGAGATGELDGLFLVQLETLTGTRLDPPTGGPGPRTGVALRFDQATRRVYLFGGRHGEQRYNDLWSFDMDTGLWTQVTDGTEPGAPREMERGALLVSPVDGSVSVLSGQVETTAGEPAWRYTAQGWKSYSATLGYE